MLEPGTSGFRLCAGDVFCMERNGRKTALGFKKGFSSNFSMGMREGFKGFKVTKGQNAITDDRATTSIHRRFIGNAIRTVVFTIKNFNMIMQHKHTTESKTAT